MFFKNSKNPLKDSFFDDINGCCLDKNQRKIVMDNSDSLLVVAGAGSGKTLTIIAKIKYLIEKLHINEKDILCISFTNETVNNLIKKVGYNIDCYTFHKLSLRILDEFNYPYNIVNSDTLEYLINEYFETTIFNNDYYIYVIDYFNNLLNKELTYDDIVIKHHKEFILYKNKILSFINRIKCNNHDFGDIKNYLIKNNKLSNKDQELNKSFLIITLNIYAKYLEELNSVLGIDFDFMITKSMNVVKDHGMYHQYKYIIIDEFQDTSIVRYQLIKEIINKTKAKIMCVGDDYQSIYAFSGCNLDLFINFQNYFNNSKIRYINKTYRNSYEVVDTSCHFIKKNPYQLKKSIKANFTLKRPFYLIYYLDDYKGKFYKLLDYLINIGKYKILVLGRNNKDIYELVDEVDDNYFIYKNIKIKYLTVHRSKGLEEDDIILINMNDDYLGFPNKIKDDKVFSLINDNKEKYLYAEERRLFYVALTRTRKCVYMLCNYKHPSMFVSEIINKINILNL